MKVKVTVCELNPSGQARDDDLAALKDHIHTHDSDFLLLPEMNFSDWLASNQTVEVGRWMQAIEDHKLYMKDLATLGVPALLGTRPIVNDAGSRRNQAYVWTKDAGAQGFHEKYYLPDEPGYWENTWYDRGLKQFDTAYVQGMRIGVQICTEMWFFEWARHYAKARVDLLCVPRATPMSTRERWLFGGQTAAVCAGAYCLSSNLWRPVDDGAYCGGMGFIIDPSGTVLAQTDQDNKFATVEIDLNISRDAKAEYPRYVPE